MLFHYDNFFAMIVTFLMMLCCACCGYLRVRVVLQEEAVVVIGHYPSGSNSKYCNYPCYHTVVVCYHYQHHNHYYSFEMKKTTPYSVASDLDAAAVVAVSKSAYNYYWPTKGITPVPKTDSNSPTDHLQLRGWRISYSCWILCWLSVSIRGR